MSKSDKNKVLGEGSYGCVIKPALKCSKEYGEVNYTNKVSKLMDEINAHDEFAENNMVYKINDIEKYILPKPVICRPELSDQKIRLMLNKELKKCAILKKKFFYSKFKLLLLEDGGVDLDNFTKTYNYSKSDDIYTFQKLPVIKQLQFFKSLIHLFDTIIFFRKNNLIHHDIKLQNIVYNSNTNKSFLIDFGLLTTDDKILDDSYTLSVSHVYFPPETSCIRRKVYKKNSKCNKYKELASYDTLVNKHINTFDSYCLSLDLLELFRVMWAKVEHLKDNKLTKNLFRNFYINVYYLLLNYCNKDVFVRSDNLEFLKEQYVTFLTLLINDCVKNNIIKTHIKLDSDIEKNSKTLPSANRLPPPHPSVIKKKTKSSKTPILNSIRSSKKISSDINRKREIYKKYTRKQLQQSAKRLKINGRQKNIELINQLAKKN